MANMRTRLLSHFVAVLILCLPGFLLACASPRSCPSVDEEVISVCRAEVACGRGTGARAAALFFGGMGSGLAGGRNEGKDSYNRCIDRQLSAQRYAAGIEDKTVRCSTRRISSDEAEAKCALE